MTTKILEAFFRHKLLILLPPLLIPLLVGPIALLQAPVYYEAWTGIWVDRPQYLAYSQAGWNAYATPAQNQANALGEQLKTRQFMMDIAKRTQLAPLVGNQRGEDRILTIFNTGLSITPNGEHLLVLHFRADTPRLAYDLLNATLDNFKEGAATDRVNQASLAISFYEAQLQDRQDNLNKLTASARQYIAANPRLGSLSPQKGEQIDPVLPVTSTDPQLADLMGQIQFSQTEIARLRSQLETARFDASAGLEGQELGFQVIDQAQVPVAPTRALRKQLIYPIGGLVGGFALSAVLLVLLVAGDRAVRSESDLPNSARVLGVMPQLKLKLRRIPKSARRDAMRRAIGFAAGTALPAPGGSK